MRDRLPAIERALTLAKSGDIASLTELRARLRKEGYGSEANEVFGKGLKMQLIHLIAASKPNLLQKDFD